MRDSSRDWRVWLAASMFPLKLSTVAAISWLIIWHATLPRDESTRSTLYAADDFSKVARYVRFGYFLIAFVLVSGGIVQWFKHSRKSASWSLAFGIGALVIGLWLGRYCDYNMYMINQ